MKSTGTERWYTYRNNTTEATIIIKTIRLSTILKIAYSGIPEKKMEGKWMNEKCGKAFAFFADFVTSDEITEI